MNDGNMLLKAVMRANAKDSGANRALVDWILEHAPSGEEKVELRVKFRVREGVVRVSLAPAKWVFKSGWSKMQPVNDEKLLRVDVFHIRGKKGTRGRNLTEWMHVSSLAISIESTLGIFRS